MAGDTHLGSELLLRRCLVWGGFTLVFLFLACCDDMGFCKASNKGIGALLLMFITSSLFVLDNDGVIDVDDGVTILL